MGQHLRVFLKICRSGSVTSCALRFLRRVFDSPESLSVDVPSKPGWHVRVDAVDAAVVCRHRLVDS